MRLVRLGYVRLGIITVGRIMIASVSVIFQVWVRFSIVPLTEPEGVFGS